MKLFMSFLTIDVIKIEKHLGSDTGWTKYENEDIKFTVGGGWVDGVEYLDSLIYKKDLHNPYNNHVTALNIFDLLNKKGRVLNELNVLKKGGIKNKNVMIKRLDFMEWARNNGHGKKQVPIDMLEIILDYQKYAESEFKNLDIQRVSHLFGERYPMCEPQPVQLDCRETECRYHKNGACNNVAPAITVHKGKVTCWTGLIRPND